MRRILDGTDRVMDVFESAYHPGDDGQTWREWLAELEATLRRPGDAPNERLGA